MTALRAGGAAILAGISLTVGYTALISGADAITKMFAASYAAPQLFALSGGIVALFAVLADRARGAPRGLRTACPRAMAVRSIATVLGAAAFFYAFRLLPFAEVFLFIAMIPLFTALLSGPVLGEAVRLQAWGALMLGLVGLLCLAPGGISSLGAGHAVALAAVMLGTVSMMASRYIGTRDGNLLAQVFWPNLSLAGIMACVLPFVWAPMGLGDLGWVCLYSALLFAARWLLVGAFRALPAYVITPLMNLQFLWMVAIGAAVFGEVPGAALYLGAALVITAGAWLIFDQAFPAPAARKVVPAE
ncbi:DMT family transporter [Roseovarius dicentrarchi]|uniref:DMT family transporter n=1 Tax=Roseovarius dicentrarchi TaxID=2250573 RepID=UPI000DE83E77|nr:DMT family transporter [Roseovarius dicentrarchi]